jgi:murein tripeptide amidase MpaA
MEQRINISSNFDSGNIRVISTDTAENIQLEINKDSNSDFYQWFHFRLQSTAKKAHRMRIVNAAGAAYVKGWEGYKAVASYDRVNWFRVETQYQDGELIIDHTPEHSSTFYAYFAPYNYEQHLDLLQTVQQSPLCHVEHLGETVDGRDMDLVVISDSDGNADQNNKSVWIIARQHPGEVMAEWFCEGLLDRLLNGDDAVAKKLLKSCTFYLVINMNPDGSVRGNLRTNAAGANLNREWLEPSMERSPEVYLVREKMLQTKVDLFMDIHGDEAIPFNFLAGCEGIPSYDDRHKSIEDCFKQAFLKASPDFQVEHGYPPNKPGKANMSMANTWVGEQFHCLSYTLEMPFKDNNDLPDPIFGWSAERSYHLGESVLLPILETISEY